MEEVEGEADRLVVPLQEVDGDSGSACGSQLWGDAEQLRPHLVPLGNLSEGDGLVVADAPQRACPDAHIPEEGVAPPCCDVAMIDACVFAPGRDVVARNLQLCLREGVAPDGREREVAAQEPFRLEPRGDGCAGAQRDVRAASAKSATSSERPFVSVPETSRKPEPQQGPFTSAGFPVPEDFPPRKEAGSGAMPFLPSTLSVR